MTAKAAKNIVHAILVNIVDNGQHTIHLGTPESEALIRLAYKPAKKKKSELTA